MRDLQALADEITVSRKGQRPGAATPRRWSTHTQYGVKTMNHFQEQRYLRSEQRIRKWRREYLIHCTRQRAPLQRLLGRLVPAWGHA
ncbi:hypothetical protein [Kistimonas scapharcae]